MTVLLSFTKRHPLIFLNPANFKLNRENKEIMRRHRSEALLFPTEKGNAVVYIVRLKKKKKKVRKGSFVSCAHSSLTGPYYIPFHIYSKLESQSVTSN